jgi:hypothetical protein
LAKVVLLGVGADEDDESEHAASDAVSVNAQAAIVVIVRGDLRDRFGAAHPS